MPLKNLLVGIAFDPETTQALSEAYEAAWQSLKDANDPLAAEPRAESSRHQLAKRMIELAQQGERDPERLCSGAIERLRATDWNR